MSGTRKQVATIVSDNDDLTNLAGLGNLATLDGELQVYNNGTLESLAGLDGLTTVGGDIAIYDEVALPNCEICDLLDQLTAFVDDVTCHDNLDDSCGSTCPLACP